MKFDSKTFTMLKHISITAHTIKSYDALLSNDSNVST